jgi:hypothetical protein
MAVDATKDDALLPLQLRIHLLETLLAGSASPTAALARASPAPLARRANQVIKGLRDAVESSGSDAVKRFLDSCTSAPFENPGTNELN